MSPAGPYAYAFLLFIWLKYLYIPIYRQTIWRSIHNVAQYTRTKERAVVNGHIAIESTAQIGPLKSSKRLLCVRYTQ